MSEEQKDSTTTSNEPTPQTQDASGETSVLSSIEERLIQADNSQDIVLWTQVLGSSLERAQFRIRLSRFGIGPST